MNEEELKELKELEKKARLAESEDCKEYRNILIDMVFDYSKSDIDPSALKGMVRLLANTRGWDKQYNKKINELKELKK